MISYETEQKIRKVLCTKWTPITAAALCVAALIYMDRVRSGAEAEIEEEYASAAPKAGEVLNESRILEIEKASDIAYTRFQNIGMVANSRPFTNTNTRATILDSIIALDDKGFATSLKALCKRHSLTRDERDTVWERIKVMNPGELQDLTNREFSAYSRKLLVPNEAKASAAAGR